jgi:anaerobic selenocysteine-containing dehydrogenase
MLNVMINEGLVDAGYIAAHTAGFAALAEMVRNYPPAIAAEICGIPTAGHACRRRAGSPAAARRSRCTARV